MTTARVRPISGLPLAGQLDGSEVIPSVQGGAAVGITAQKLGVLAAQFTPPGNATKQSVGLGNVDNLSTNQLAQPGNPVGDRLPGVLSAGKFTSRPDAVQIQGAGSTGDASGFSVLLPDTAETKTLAAAIARRLDKSGGDITSEGDRGISDIIQFGNTGIKQRFFSRRTNNQQSLLGTTAIVRNGPGSGTFGPGTADFALLLSAVKDNWQTSTIDGEIDSLIIAGAQGKKGDITPILANVSKRRDSLNVNAADENGAPLGFEIGAQLIGADGQVYHEGRSFAQFLENPIGLSKGAGYGFHCVSARGFFFSAYGAQVNAQSGTDQFGNPRLPNGFARLIFLSVTEAVDGSGIIYEVQKNGRTYTGFPNARTDHGFDPAQNEWTLNNEAGTKLFGVERTSGAVNAVNGVKIGTSDTVKAVKRSIVGVDVGTIPAGGYVQVNNISAPGVKAKDVLHVTRGDGWSVAPQLLEAYCYADGQISLFVTNPLSTSQTIGFQAFVVTATRF